MKFLRCACLVLPLVFAPACVYTNVVVPLDTDVTDTSFGAKVGEADSYMVMGMAAWGDRGTKAAADAGGIVTVRHIDVRYFAILWPIYANTTTIVYGD